MAPYFVSFYPRIAMEENLSVFESLDSPAVRQLLKNAAGILLPPYLPPWRYQAVTRLARRWFPRLQTRFDYLGKSRQILLFRRLGVRCPETRLFDTPSRLLAYFDRYGSPWAFPMVLKGDSGGGGSSVHPIHRPADLARCIAKLPPHEPALLQQWIDHGGRDLRVVTYGDHAVSYFRIGDGGFYNNVCRGGRISHELRPDQQERGSRAVLEFCKRAEIDIAGFDLMYPDDGPPVFVEINFHFGHKGLGGVTGHLQQVLKAVQRWRASILRGT